VLFSDKYKPTRHYFVAIKTKEMNTETTFPKFMKLRNVVGVTRTEYVKHLSENRCVEVVRWKDGTLEIDEKYDGSGLKTGAFDRMAEYDEVSEAEYMGFIENVAKQLIAR
jgi:hypothetical protein